MVHNLSPLTKKLGRGSITCIIVYEPKLLNKNALEISDKKFCNKYNFQEDFVIGCGRRQSTRTSLKKL